MLDINIEEIGTLVSVYGLKILGAAAIFLVGRWLCDLAAKVIRRIMRASQIDETLVSFTANIIYFGALTFVVIAALGQLGIQTTSIAAIIAAAGLAIGLALQGSLGNLASGVMIIGMRPFRIGDLIEVSGKKGIVLDISIFTTTLHSDDQSRIIIPNGKITADIIVNHTLRAMDK